MAIVSLNTIKNWFRTSKKPTQGQFWDTFDSFYHKEEKLQTKDVDRLDYILNNKLDTAQFDGHVADKNNPHSVTAEQIGLGDIQDRLDNKLDANDSRLHDHDNYHALNRLDEDEEGAPTWNGEAWPSAAPVATPTLQQVAEAGNRTYKTLNFAEGRANNDGIVYQQLFGKLESRDVPVFDGRIDLETRTVPFTVPSPLGTEDFDLYGTLYLLNSEKLELYISEKHSIDEDNIALVVYIKDVVLDGMIKDIHLGDIIVNKFNGNGEINIQLPFYTPQFFDHYTVEESKIILKLVYNDEKFLTPNSFSKPLITPDDTLFEDSRILVKNKQGYLSTVSVNDLSGGSADPSHTHDNMYALSLINSSSTNEPTWNGLPWPAASIPTLEQVARAGNVTYRPLLFAEGTNGMEGINYDQVFGLNSYDIDIVNSSPVLEHERDFHINLMRPIGGSHISGYGAIVLFHKGTGDQLFFVYGSNVHRIDNYEVFLPMVIEGELPTGEKDAEIGEVIVRTGSGEIDFNLVLPPALDGEYDIATLHAGLKVISDDEKVLSLKSFDKETISKEMLGYEDAKIIVRDSFGNLKTISTDTLATNDSNMTARINLVTNATPSTYVGWYKRSGNLTQFSLDIAFVAGTNDRQLTVKGFSSSPQASIYIPVVTSNILLSEGSLGLVAEFRMSINEIYFWETVNGGSWVPFKVSSLQNGSRIMLNGVY